MERAYHRKFTFQSNSTSRDFILAWEDFIFGDYPLLFEIVLFIFLTTGNPWTTRKYAVNPNSPPVMALAAN